MIWKVNITFPDESTISFAISEVYLHDVFSLLRRFIWVTNPIMVSISAKV